MQNCISKLKIFENLRFFLYEKEASEIFKKIYSKRESPDSPGGFGFKRAGKINSRII
jgi:hypothetical protein